MYKRKQTQTKTVTFQFSRRMFIVQKSNGQISKLRLCLVRV